MPKKSFKNIALAAGVAAAAGFVAGLLTAPKSGKETREDIKKAAKSGLAQAEHQLKTLSNELGDAVNEAKARSKDLTGRAGMELDELAGRATAAREKVREMISAVHDGDAEDDDLRLAVDQGSSALKHLRDYMRK